MNICRNYDSNLDQKVARSYYLSLEIKNSR